MTEHLKYNYSCFKKNCVVVSFKLYTFNFYKPVKYNILLQSNSYFPLAGEHSLWPLRTFFNNYRNIHHMQNAVLEVNKIKSLLSQNLHSWGADTEQVNKLEKTNRAPIWTEFNQSKERGCSGSWGKPLRWTHWSCGLHERMSLHAKIMGTFGGREKGSWTKNSLLIINTEKEHFGQELM